MAPYCTVASSSSSSCTDESNHCRTTTSAAPEGKQSLNVLWAVEKKIKSLQEHNRKLIREMSEVEGIVSKKYPDLSAARAVSSDSSRREYDETRWRVRIALKSLAKKAEKMVEAALDDQINMLGDIAIQSRGHRKIRENQERAIQKAQRGFLGHYASVFSYLPLIMAPNVTVLSFAGPTAAKTTAFSLDALITQCREKKASSSSPTTSDAITSKKPAFSLDALIAECQKRKASEVTPSISTTSENEIAELTKKLSLLQKARQQVYLSTEKVPEIMAAKYPDLAIARAVLKSNGKRTRAVRDKYGWRQYIGVWDMREKAEAIIEKEKADRLKMYDALADELKTISKAIAAANLRLQNVPRKRSFDPELEEGELIESPQKKKKRSE